MTGILLQWLINTWVRLTGKKLSIEDNPWISGPVSENDIVGDDFYQQYAKQHGLTISKDTSVGLLPDFKVVVNESDSNREKLNDKIAHFYEHTSDYKLDVWAQWSGPIQFFAKALISLLSKKMKQLNIPLNPLETSYGMSSEVIPLLKKGIVQSTCWLRKSIKSNQVVYAGFYSSCYLPKLKQNCVKVVFPLPKGSVTVILKVEVQPDGSVKLVSHGSGIGQPGYYRVRSSGKGFVRVKYIPLKEIIHVFEDESGILRTNHEFYFWGSKFLELHYKMLGV